MSVKSTFNNRVEKAKEFAESLRKVYRDAYQKAVDVTSERVDDLRKMGQQLSVDGVKETLSNKVHAAQVLVDDLNKNLAERAIPAFRKAGVEVKSHKTSEIEPVTAVKSATIDSGQVEQGNPSPEKATGEKKAKAAPQKASRTPKVTKAPVAPKAKPRSRVKKPPQSPAKSD